MIRINNTEDCRTLTNEYLENLDNIKVLYMNNSMIYALEQKKVNIINNLLSSKYQDMNLIKKIVENYFHITVLVPIVENPKLDNNIISYIIDNIEQIELPSNPDWVRMNKNSKEFFEVMILDALYSNENINEELKEVLDKKCSSFFIEKTKKSDEINVIYESDKLKLDEEHLNKRFIVYKGITFEGVENGCMGLSNHINKLFAIELESDSVLVKSIPIGFLDDTEIHEYNNMRLQLLFTNNSSTKKFLYIKGDDCITVDELDILEIKKLISGEFRTAKHYHIEEYGDFYKVINRQHTFVFDHKKNKIIDIIKETA